MDKLRRMEIFVAVAEAEQFTRAAHTLGLSKSAVSHAIRDLENYLGVHLLDRNNQGVGLTTAGQKYLTKCSHILSEVKSLEDEIRRQSRSLTGRVRLTAPTSFGAEKVAPVIASFANRYPSVQIDVDLSDTKMDLEKERIDLAIRISDLKDSSLIARKIMDQKRFLYASPEFCQTHSHITNPADLKKVNCLKYKGTPIWTLIRNRLEHKILPKGSIASNSGQAIRELAVAGKGVAYLPEFLAKSAVKKGELRRFMPNYAGKPIGLYAIYPQRRHREAHVRLLIDYIVDALSDANKAHIN